MSQFTQLKPEKPEPAFAPVDFEAESKMSKAQQKKGMRQGFGTAINQPQSQPQGGEEHRSVKIVRHIEDKPKKFVHGLPLQAANHGTGSQNH